MLSIILIVLILGTLIFFSLNICIYYIFTKKNSLVGDSFATRKDYTHTENVPTISGRTLASLRTVRHQTKAIYTYKVNDKSYKLRNIYRSKPGETPRSIGIKYIKKHPYIAVSTEVGDTANSDKFLIRAILCLSIAVFCFFALMEL